MTASVAHELLAHAAGGLLGRDEEMVGVEGALEGSRLVTLTGAPGIGKTRLALAMAGSRGDGAAVVELASVADGAQVPAALASALSVKEVPSQSLLETIVATHGGRRLLLVLDNCEHLLAACARVVEQLLVGCPQLRVLATSREPLGLEGEQVWRVPPLPVPARGDDFGPEELISYPAVALFVARAREVQPGFALHAFLAADVAEICWRLEGVPLAIELAAAGVEMLNPSEIAGRLQNQLNVLSGRASGPPARHQTLEAALDWSHTLLSAPERVLLRRLSVFAGWFDLAAADAICAGVEVDPPGISRLLARLVAKSLVVADADGAGPRRYRLLETIRAYAREKLEQAGEVGELRTAHAYFYLTLAERAEPELTGPGQEHWLGRLEADHANLRAAVEWSLGHARAEWALRLAGALVLFWRMRCHFSEGRDLLRAALAASDYEATALKAKALWGEGFMTLMAGDPIGAIPSLEQSLGLFREVGDRRGCARALLILGNSLQSYGALRAVEPLQQSVALAREAGDSWCLSHALALAGFGCCSLRNLDAARPLFEECLTVAREAQDAQGIRFALLGLGDVAFSQGDWALAESLSEEAGRVADDLGEPYVKAAALGNLGVMAVARGDYGRARGLLDEAISLTRHISTFSLTGFLVARAHVARVEADRPLARQLLEEAAALARARLGPLPGVLAEMGDLLVDEGNTTGARRLFEEALEYARNAREGAQVATALYSLGELARGAGETERAAILHTEALDLQHRAGHAPGIVMTLEALAGVATLSGRSEYAARLFGAASASRAKVGLARLPWESVRFDADVRLLKASVPAKQFIGAWSDGERAALDDVVAGAVDGQDSPLRVPWRWSSLTESEARAARLAADGLTNPQIAERLQISPWTVKIHLARVYKKLGVAGRTELSRAGRTAEHPYPT